MHGRDKYSGLAWEHFSSGIRPSDGGRWSAATFNKRTYRATQDQTVVRPFLADLAAKTVIFDFPYFDLSLAPDVWGITSWGAHDPGVAPASRPDGLHQEMTDRFGPYPAPEWIYGFCWPSAQKAQTAGEALTHATEVRSRASRWLLKERLPDWDLGIVVISECHSAVEPLWHGVDANHPLHALESAPPAAAALRKVYAAIDHMIGDLHQTFSDAILVLVAMHGMGPNDSDVPAMVLLPELLYIADQVLEKIPDHTALIADVTQLNFNVAYEIGFALAKGRRVVQTRHKGITPHRPWTYDVGVFDAIRYLKYENAEELERHIRGIA